MSNEKFIDQVTHDFTDFSDEKDIRKANDDILRYKKNKFSSGFAILSILFNVFYFISIYKSDVGNFYYKIIIGASVLYNLVFMLTAFLCAEGVKNYKLNFAIILIIVGILQISRLFILPLQAKRETITTTSGPIPVMDATQFTWIAIFLIASATFAIIGGIVGILKHFRLRRHLAEIGRTE